MLGRIKRYWTPTTSAFDGRSISFVMWQLPKQEARALYLHAPAELYYGQCVTIIISPPPSVLCEFLHLAIFLEEP